MSISNKYGYVKDGKVYRNPFLNNPEREIGVVKEDAESSLKYFEERYERLVKKIQETKEKINSTDNKGSFLMKIVHLRNQLPEYDGLGDFEALKDQLEQMEEDINGIISVNRVKNLEIKKSLIAEAKAALDNPDKEEAEENLKEIKQKWIRTGMAVDEEEEKLQQEFQSVYDIYYQRKQELWEARQAIVAAKKAEYDKLLDSTGKLFRERDSQVVAEKLREIKGQWYKLEKLSPSAQSFYERKFKKMTGKLNFRLKKSSNFRKPGGGGNYQGGYQQNVNEILKKKKELLEKMKNLANDEQPVLDDVKAVQSDYKNLKVQNKFLVKDLNKEFYFNCDLAYEKEYVNMLVSMKFKKDPASPDSIKDKVSILSDLIERDQKEIDQYKENSSQFNVNSGFNNVINSKLMMKERKILAKKFLLNEFQGIIKSKS